MTINIPLISKISLRDILVTLLLNRVKRYNVLHGKKFPFNLHFLTSAVGNVTLVSWLKIINEKLRLSRATLDAYVERKATSISQITVVNAGLDANHRISRANGMFRSGAIKPNWILGATTVCRY